MPKIRDYASEENARAALEREGLILDNVTITYDPAGGRYAPIFSFPMDAPGAEDLVARLDKEGFAHVHPEKRDTFTIPEGHEAVRDSAGRATGEVQKITEELLNASAEQPRERRSSLNTHLSDLFFNYDHSAFSEANAAEEVSEDPRWHIRTDAEAFAASVLGAFGVAVDVDELVADFFERL